MKAMLEGTEKGGVRQSIRNCLTVFQRDPLLSGAIAYNILTDRKDIIKPIGFHRESTALNDTDMKYLLLYLEETYGLTNEKKIDNAIGIVANENKYHPIRDYLSSLVWDGTERIRFCLRHFLGADADDYTYEALKLFLLGAISRAFQPGCKFEIMLCLVGGQGAGKSTFFRLLAVRDEWFSDDLRKLDDDNVYRKLQGHWIIEMSEMMATANAKSMNRYVRRGSKGIALLDQSSSVPRLHYVFDVSDTGVRRNSRDPEVWQLGPDLVQPVSEMIAREYGVYHERLSQQISDLTGKLVDSYWDNNSGDMLLPVPVP